MKTSTTSTAQTADSKSLSNIRFITITALFIALTYVFTAFINIRLPITANGGLIHLGNVPLFICAIIFGKKSGAIAGGVGMGLFDLLSGWMSHLNTLGGIRNKKSIWVANPNPGCGFEPANT